MRYGQTKAATSLAISKLGTWHAHRRCRGAQVTVVGELRRRIQSHQITMPPGDCSSRGERRHDRSRERSLLGAASKARRG
jgi:hypothetical protein